MRRIGLKTWYSVHRWSSIVTGIFILLWLISGLLITAHTFFPIDRITNSLVPQPDYANIQLKPAEAVALLEDSLESDLSVKNVALIELHDTVAYQIVAGSESFLVDGFSGEQLLIDQANARRIAEAIVGVQAAVDAVFFRGEHSFAYLSGPLPAYEFYLDDELGSRIAVSTINGSFLITNRVERMLNVAELLHTFKIITLITPSQPRLGAAILWIIIVGSAATSLVGYYLALPLRWLRRKEITGVKRNRATNWFSLEGLYKIHKWTSIVGGIALLMWLCTAVAMSWNKLFPKADVTPLTEFDVEADSLSPAGAIVSLGQELGGTITAKSVALKTFADQIAYVITGDDSSVYLVDANSGKMMAISAQFAEQIALTSAPTEASVSDVELIDDRRLNYSFGPVPIYRIIYDDFASTHVFVSPSTGDVFTRDRVDRARVFWGAFHEYYALRIITDNTSIITGLLWISTFVVIATVLIGYYMALPHKRRPRRR